MDVKLYQKVIYRYDCQEDPNIDHHIQSVKRNLIASIDCDPHQLPQVGDIYYLAGYPFKIVNRIFKPTPVTNKIERMVCEISAVRNIQQYQYGLEAWDEEIPLVTDCEDMQPPTSDQNEGKDKNENT